MPYFPFSPYEPDNALLNEDASKRTINALPGTGGFDPIPALISPFPPLPVKCCSLWGCSNANESFIFCGSDTNLYRLLNGKWVDVTRQDENGDPVPYHIFDEIGWSFINFQQTPMCCGRGDAPQIWDASLQRFRNLENNWQLPNPTPEMRNANPEDNPQLNPVPWGRSIACNNEFVFILAADEKLSRMYQSGTRQPEVWQTGQQDSMYNDFDIGGEVMAVSQGTSPIVLMRKAIYQYQRADLQGAFSIIKVANGIGQFYYNSSAILNDTIYFLDEYGFYAMSEAGQMRPIGFNKVNNWIREVLSVHIPKCRISAFADEKNMRIYWNFMPNKPALPPQPDYPEGEPYAPFSLVYDVLRDSWSRLTHAGVAATIVPWRAISLDELTNGDPMQGDNQVTSLDTTLYDFEGYIPCFLNIDGVTVQMQASNQNEGAFLQASWQGQTDQAMSLINKFQPIIENPDFNAEGQLECDMTAGHDPFYTPWVRQSKIDGAFRVCVRARTAKARIRLPFGTRWTKAQGIDMDIKSGGSR